MIKRFLHLTTLAALLIWAAGCSESPTESGSLTEILNLNDATGGYLATDEAPGFGDTDLLGEIDEAEEYDDPILLSPEVDSIIADPVSGYYHMRILWGQMDLDTSVTNLTDWTGSLTITRGALIVRQVIRFERGQDAILPRMERTLIEWESYTNIHNDGIGVDIFVPPIMIDPADSSVIDVPVTVTFETGPYSRTFELAELSDLDTIVYLDDADSNAVAFRAFRLDRLPCPRGFLAGHWGYNDEGEGVFRGLWMSHRGLITGFLRGHFGVNDEGRNVFFGKWISRNGRFSGFLRGRWEPLPGPHANQNAVMHAGGRFEGEILDESEMVIGKLRGKYKSHPRFNYGYLQGRWKLYCDEEDGSNPDFQDDGM